MEDNINEELTDLDNNDDMVAESAGNEEHISFKVSEAPAPERKWTKNDKRTVWIIAVIITIIGVVALFFLNGIDFNNFSLF
ncbi:MAG: hypothetical protein J1E39_07850 [Eubacterium sp.]|nr:hypothetical protein [Eubacterium sp.]